MKQLIISIFLALTILFGCKQDIGNTSWDVDMLAPVVRTRLTLADLLADSLLEANSEGLLRLKLETPLIDFPLDSILKIPDTSVVTAISLPFDFLDVPPGTDVYPIIDNTQYELDDLALKEILVREGTLRLKAKSILGTEVDFIYLIPGAKKTGVAFETNQTIDAGSITDTATIELEFDLSGYMIDLRGSSGTSFNTMGTTYILSTSENGQVVSIFQNQPFFFLEYSFVDIVPEYGAGYFGQASSSVDNEVTDIDVLNKITDGQIFLDSVSIGIRMINGVGADARFNLSTLSSINTRQNTIVNLNHDIISDVLLLTRAQNPTGIAEDVVPSELNFRLDNSNSNVKQFIENLPNQLGFTFDFELNPLGNISASNDFFYYSRPFEALMNIDIPVRATLSNLTLVDTLEWNLSESGSVVESVDHGSFTVIANNGLPLGAELELILLNENMETLETLVAPSSINAPVLDSENKVAAPLETRVLIPVPSAILAVLPQARHIYMKVKFSTSNQPVPVEFYSSYGIDIKLTGNFNINFGASSL